MHVGHVNIVTLCLTVHEYCFTSWWAATLFMHVSGSRSHGPITGDLVHILAGYRRKEGVLLRVGLSLLMGSDSRTYLGFVSQRGHVIFSILRIYLAIAEEASEM